MATKRTTSTYVPKITALDNFTESINMLVYSDPGAGKTVLGGTTNGLIVATEPGTVSAKRMGSTAQLVKPANLAEFLQLLKWGKNNSKPGEWWVVDTLTELQSMVIRGILEDAHKANASRDLDTPAIQDYMKWQLLFKRIVKALNDLPCNVLYTCHAMREEDEDGEPIILPDISGKNGTNDPTTMSRWVSGTVHAYGYLTVKKREGEEFRRLICKRTGPYFGKDRYGVLAPHIDEPNMLEIQKRIDDSTNGTPAARAPRKSKAKAETTEDEE